MDVDLRTLDVEPSDRLGIAFPAGDYETYAALADAGFGRARLGVSWERVQPAPDEWNFEGLDARITILTSLGLEPLLTFASTADWATRSGDNKALNEIPISMEVWEDFVGTVAARYADFVDLYQVANEFVGFNNLSGGWGGTPFELVEYVNTAHDAVKASDPGAAFVMGGVASLVADIALVNLGYAEFDPEQLLSPTTSMRFSVDDVQSPLMDFLLEWRLRYAIENARYDMAAVHLYGDRGLDALRIELIEDLTGRGVISTESGAPTFDPGRAPSPTDYFAASVMSDLGALAAGAETVYWFQDYASDPTFYNQHVPLRDANGDPKPSFWAKKLLATYLVEDAVVSDAADGVYRIRSASEGEVVMGFAKDLADFARGLPFWMSDIWVLEDPDTGLLSRLELGDTPAAEDFVVIDTGWLAAAADARPRGHEGVSTGSASLSFLRAVADRTKIDMLRDGELVDEFIYAGVSEIQKAELDRLGLTLSAKGDAEASLGLGHGVLGVASDGENAREAGRIGPGEALVIEIDPDAGGGDHAAIRLDAVDVAGFGRMRFVAYRNGERVANEEMCFDEDGILFDPGLAFDAVEIGTDLFCSFSLQILEVEWYQATVI